MDSVKDPLSDLVAACQNGDETAFRKLVEETQDDVYSLAYHMLDNIQEAEDMTQEVYLHVWRGLPGFRGDAKFSTWLYRITINACLNRRRHFARRLHVIDNEDALEDSIAKHGDPAEATMKEEQRAVLWKTVSYLPPKYRTVIDLFYQKQLSYKEIAELLSVPLGTVKGHLNRARKALAKRLRHKEEAPSAFL
ncbi:MAG: sigma-70 family RNA polymerase sigma factor [Chloroflexota bacterium]|nr:sigma-70 family RNA polymerase sigma factor [Chloroflexota bacterium]